MHLKMVENGQHMQRGIGQICHIQELQAGYVLGGNGIMAPETQADLESSSNESENK